MGSEFGITKAIGSAYRFVWQERKYLLRHSLLPVGVTMLTDALLFLNPDPARTLFEVALWNLPSIALAGWFVFVETRLLMLGERTEALPAAPEYMAARRASMQQSVLVFMLIYMGLIAMIGGQAQLMSAANEGQSMPTASDLALSGAGMVVFGIMIWAARYGVAHILAAVDFPVKQYIFRVSGLGISFRLLGLSFLCVVPVLFIFGIIANIITPGINPDTGISLTMQTVLLNVVMYYIVISLLNAAAVFALREILGRREA